MLSRASNISNYQIDSQKCTLKCLDYFNQEDGSNNFNKLLNEFGLFLFF